MLKFDGGGYFWDPNSNSSNNFMYDVKMTRHLNTWEQVSEKIYDVILTLFVPECYCTSRVYLVSMVLNGKILFIVMFKHCQ